MRPATEILESTSSNTQQNMFSPPSTIAWTSGSFSHITSTSFVEFNAPQLASIPLNPFNLRTLNHHKRKSEILPPLPSKQKITEEKMAAHLNGLHISSDYTEHHSNTATERSQSSSNYYFDSSSGLMDSDMNLNYNYQAISAKDLEEKLKKASRVTLCEQIRKLQSQDDGIIPKALLARYERPCTALVVWQPPKPLEKLVTPFDRSALSKSEQKDEESNKNNTDNLVMDTDL